VSATWQSIDSLTRRDAVLILLWAVIPAHWVWAGGWRQWVALEAAAASYWHEERLAGRVPSEWYEDLRVRKE
jgi:hypothetical protein